MKTDDSPNIPWRQRTAFHLGVVLVILLLGSAFSLHHGLRAGRFALMNQIRQQGRFLCERIGDELQKASPDIDGLLRWQAEGPLGIGRVKGVWYYRAGAPVLEMAGKDIPSVPGEVVRSMREAPAYQSIPRRNWAYLIICPMGKAPGDFLAIHLDCWVPLETLFPFIPHPDWPLWGLVGLLLAAYAVIIHSLTRSKTN